MELRAFKFLFISFCLLISANLGAQENTQFGMLPALNLRKSLHNNWKLNFKVESRQQFSKKTNGINQNYEYLLTDLSVIVAKKTGLNNSLASGYLTRLEDGSTSHRFIEQFTIVRRYNGFRLSHRFRADFTLNNNEKPETRLRYRIAPEIPLSGLAVDKNEFYLKMNNEYVLSFQNRQEDLEVRLVSSLGYRLSKNNRFELGLDYRIDNFVSNNTRSRYWLLLNWYGSI